MINPTDYRLQITEMYQISGCRQASQVLALLSDLCSLISAAPKVDA